MIVDCHQERTDATVVGPLPSLAIDSSEFIAAIDAESTRILIPAKNVRRTEALTRDDVTTPALCRLFLVGRCRQSARCHQIHADPDVVQRLRQHALANPSCCMAHTPGECAAAARQVLHLLPPGLTLDVEGTMVGVMQLDPTRGLVELCQKAAFSPVIPCTRSQVCRNHSPTTLCRFGDDCGFLHVCKHVMVELFGPQAPAASQRQTGQQKPSSRTAQKGTFTPCAVPVAPIACVSATSSAAAPQLPMIPPAFGLPLFPGGVPPMMSLGLPPMPTNFMFSPPFAQDHTPSFPNAAGLFESNCGFNDVDGMPSDNLTDAAPMHSPVITPSKATGMYRPAKLGVGVGDAELLDAKASPSHHPADASTSQRPKLYRHNPYSSILSSVDLSCHSAGSDEDMA